jgi:hypothetical protein
VRRLRRRGHGQPAGGVDRRGRAPRLFESGRGA